MQEDEHVHFKVLSPWRKVKLVSCVRLFMTPQTVAYKAPLSMGFSRQGYWSRLPFPFPEDLPDPGIEPGSSTSQADTTIWATREAMYHTLSPCTTPNLARENCYLVANIALRDEKVAASSFKAFSSFLSFVIVSVTIAFSFSYLFLRLANATSAV